MAFAIKSIADLKSIFPYNSPPKISPNGERPNFGTLRVFQQQLNANAAAVTSHLEGVGYLGLVLSEEAYLEIDGISEPYERLAKPTRGETNGLTGPQLANVQQVYEEKLKSWDRENMVEKALQAIVLEAVDADYIECLKHDLLGFSMVSTLDIMAYLWETYGEMEGRDGNTLEVKMKEDWPEGTVSKLFKKMREGAAFFKLAGEPLSEKTLARYSTSSPASISFVSGLLVWKLSDDTPLGDFWELKRRGLMAPPSTQSYLYKAVSDWNTWLVFIQYACCFGVELTMNNAAAIYFKEEFHQSTESAAALASIFGWTNLFARGIGGYLSDRINSKYGMRGRLILQTVCLFLEGCMVITFSESKNLVTAITVMVFFSLCVQAAEGTSYAIVPYINPTATGAVSGVVGAGGNVGAVAFGMCFRQLDYHMSYKLMGIIIIISSTLSPLVKIKGEKTWAFKKTTSLKKDDNESVTPSRSTDEMIDETWLS